MLSSFDSLLKYSRIIDAKNLQNDRMGLHSNNEDIIESTYIAKRFLCTRMAFNQSLMVSVGVSKIY